VAAISILLISNQDGRKIPGPRRCAFLFESADGGGQKGKGAGAANSDASTRPNMKKLPAPALPVKAIGASAVDDDGEVPDVPARLINEVEFLAELDEVFGDGTCPIVGQSPVVLADG
jgi:hypothetical protein